MLNSFIKTYLHILLFLNIDIAQVVEILPCGRQGDCIKIFSKSYIIHSEKCQILFVREVSSN